MALLSSVDMRVSSSVLTLVGQVSLTHVERSVFQTLFQARAGCQVALRQACDEIGLQHDAGWDGQPSSQAGRESGRFASVVPCSKRLVERKDHAPPPARMATVPLVPSTLMPAPSAIPA